MDHGGIHVFQIFCAGADHHRLQLAGDLLQRIPDAFRAVFLQGAHQRLADGHGVRAPGQRLEGVKTGFDAAVRDQDQAAARRSASARYDG